MPLRFVVTNHNTKCQIHKRDLWDARDCARRQIGPASDYDGWHWDPDGINAPAGLVNCCGVWWNDKGKLPVTIELREMLVVVRDQKQS